MFGGGYRINLHEEFDGAVLHFSCFIAKSDISSCTEDVNVSDEMGFWSGQVRLQVDVGGANT